MGGGPVKKNIQVVRTHCSGSKGGSGVGWKDVMI